MNIRFLLEIAVYFAIWVPVIIFSFKVYAKTLLAISKYSARIKAVIGISAYFLFSVVLVLPVLGAMSLHDPWRFAVNNDSVSAILFFIGYIASIVPGALFFKRRYLKELKSLGYFGK